MFFNKNALRNKVQHYKQGLIQAYANLRASKEDQRLQEKKADEASRESFPASDPPGHISKSNVDKESHSDIRH